MECLTPKYSSILLHVCKLETVTVSSDGDNTAAIVGGVLGTVTVLAILGMMIMVVVQVRNRGRPHFTGTKNKYVKVTVAVLF